MPRLPSEPIHGWRSSPGEGDHGHRANCGAAIHPGDLMAGCYPRSTGVVSRPECVADDPARLREWLGEA